jgi:hypothetical protein
MITPRKNERMSDNPAAQRELIVDMAFAGHAPRMLAIQFRVTEWTVKRWVAQARRRRGLPYWQRVDTTASAASR